MPSSSVRKVPGYAMQVFAQKRASAMPACDDRNEVRRLDDGLEPRNHSEDENDENEDDSEDDRIRSTAALFSGESQSELDPDQSNWAYQSAFVQFVQQGAYNDPFDFSLLPGGAERTTDNRARFSLDPYLFEWGAREDVAVDNRERIRARMQSHADRIALYQHRTAVFSLVVCLREFRVVRWDPSGVVVSERVDYVRDPGALVEVLLAFIGAGDEGLGYDPTTTRLWGGEEDYELMDRLADDGECRIPVLPWAEGALLPPTVPIQTYATVAPAAAPPADLAANSYSYLVDDAQHNTPIYPHGEDGNASMQTTTTIRKILKDGSFVFQYVLDSLRRSLASGFPRYRLAIGSDELLVAAPLYFAMRFGATRGYVVFHKQSRTFVLLKDAWWPHNPSWKTEGEILRRLNEDGVRGVPTVVCHGAVGGQVSRVLDYWMNLGETDPTQANGAWRTAANTSGSSESENEPRGVKRARDDLEREKMWQIGAFVHYRIALKEVCLPLSTVTSSHQLVSVVGDCIEGVYRSVCMVCRGAIS